MAISWRVALLMLAGVGLIIPFPAPETLSGWLILVAAIVVTDMLLATDPRQMTFSRKVDSPIRADQSTTSTVDISAKGLRPTRIVVRDAWPPSLHPTPYVHHGVVGGDIPFRAVTTLSPERRGVHKGDYVSVRCWGPMGLAARQISVALPSNLDVLPEFRSRRLLPSRLARLQEIEGSTAVILRGPGTEFDSLRSYVRGDDPRDIDWKASARSEDLVVRTWQPERDRHVLIVVDTGRSSALLLGAPQHEEDASTAIDADSLDLGVAPRLDAQIEATLLMAGLADRAGDNVHVVALDREVHCRVSKAKGSELMSALARGFRDITPALDPIDWTLAERQVQRALRHRSLVILLTDMPQAGMNPEFIEIVGRIQRRHTVVVASALDPSLAQMSKKRSTLDEVTVATAADTEMTLTQEGAAELRRVGAHTVAVDAGLLAARTADLYVDLKKRGVL